MTTLVVDPHNFVPWRFTASDGSLDLALDVLAPVRFDEDTVSGAQLLFLLCPGATGKPIQSTREVTRYAVARHQWYFCEQGGTPTADGIIDLIATARANPAISYFSYQALSRPIAQGGVGVGKLWKVLFDLSQGLQREYQGPHRLLTVTLYEASA